MSLRLSFTPAPLPPHPPWTPSDASPTPTRGGGTTLSAKCAGILVLMLFLVCSSVGEDEVAVYLPFHSPAAAPPSSRFLSLPSSLLCLLGTLEQPKLEKLPLSSPATFFRSPFTALILPTLVATPIALSFSSASSSSSSPARQETLLPRPSLLFASAVLSEVVLPRVGEQRRVIANVEEWGLFETPAALTRRGRLRRRVQAVGILDLLAPLPPPDEELSSFRPKTPLSSSSLPPPSYRSRWLRQHRCRWLIRPLPTSSLPSFLSSSSPSFERKGDDEKGMEDNTTPPPLNPFVYHHQHDEDRPWWQSDCLRRSLKRLFGGLRVGQRDGTAAAGGPFESNGRHPPPFHYRIVLPDVQNSLRLLADGGVVEVRRLQRLRRSPLRHGRAKGLLSSVAPLWRRRRDGVAGRGSAALSSKCGASSPTSKRDGGDKETLDTEGEDRFSDRLDEVFVVTKKSPLRRLMLNMN